MTLQYTYLDASALMRMVDGDLPTSSPRNVRIKELMGAILADRERRIACSEITIMEFHSALTTYWRSPDPAWDRAQWELSRGVVMRLIEFGRVEVLPSPARLIEQAMTLVTIGTRDFGRAVRSWDAAHMLVANWWASHVDAAVEIVTSDQHFSFVDEYPPFTGRLSVLNLDLVAKTGEAADRGSN